MRHTRLLIVHHDAPTRALMTSMLQTLGARIEEAANDRAAVRMLEREPADLVLAAADPVDPDALEFLNYLRRKHPTVMVIVVLASPHADRSREALIRGAASVLRFPLPATHLRAAVAQALGMPEPVGNVGSSRSPANEATRPLAANGHGGGPPAAAARDFAPRLPARAEAGPGALVPPPARRLGGLVGEDPSLRQALELAVTIAPTRPPVLIVGEPGTGKTLVARTVHAHSGRRQGPFVELDCASSTEEELDVELFGRRAGFSEPERGGRVAAAEGGTLFLDEIARLSPAMQAKLARLLSAGEYEPVGSSATQRADVRLVAATAENLAALVEQGSFRQDLYYRLRVVSLELPPLRHRGEDIARLAEHFRERFAHELGRDLPGFSPEAMNALRAHPWPGNVVELENVVERALLHARGGRIEPLHLALNPRTMPMPRHVPTSRPHLAAAVIQPLKEALEEPERLLILKALEALSWNRQETARVLDINRTTLYKKMKKYGLLFDEPVWAN